MQYSRGARLGGGFKVHVGRALFIRQQDVLLQLVLFELKASELTKSAQRERQKPFVVGFGSRSNTLPSEEIASGHVIEVLTGVDDEHDARPQVAAFHQPMRRKTHVDKKWHAHEAERPKDARWARIWEAQTESYARPCALKKSI